MGLASVSAIRATRIFAFHAAKRRGLYAFSGCLKWGFAVNCADFCERDGAGWGMAGQLKNDTV